MSTNNKPKDTVRVRIVHARRSDKHLIVDLLKTLTAQQVISSLMESHNGTPPFLSAPTSGNTYKLTLERTKTELAPTQTMQAATVRDDDTLQVTLDGISA